MRHNTTYRSILAASLAALVLGGCQRDTLVSDDTAIRYKVTVADIATKGALVNNNDNSNYSDIALAGTLSPFRAAAYNGTTAVFDTEGLDPAGVETVTYTSGSWTMPNIYYWPQKTVLTFFAWGNLPEEGSSVTASSTGLTLDHEMVQDVAAQKDILLGYYKGLGVAGNTAEIRFRHPLTAVIFREGDLGEEKVTSITLEGLAVSGSVAMDANGTIGDWQDVAAYTATSSQSNSEGLTVDGTIGDPFILIPQNLATNGVKLTVKCKSGLTLETAIGSGEWKSQKTNWYTLNYGDPTNWTLEVTPWDAGESGDVSLLDPDYVFEASEDSHTFRNTTAQGVTTIYVTSKMLLDDEPIGNLEWTIKSYQIGISDPVTVGDSTFTAGGLTAKTTAEGNLQLTAAERTSATSGSHDYWTNNGGVSGDTDGSGWSPKSWEDKGIIDLSMLDPYTDTQNAYGMTTANCYIIRHAGTYKLPLVYGNAIVNGAFNEQSYYPNGTGGSNRLKRFQNHIQHDDLSTSPEKGIISPFIEYNTTDGLAKSGSNQYLAPASDADGYQIVWQDKADIITIDGISKESVTVKNASGVDEAFNVSYLTFTIPQSLICQNNAIIAVKDGRGKIMWSWHIWTTNDPALLTPAIPVTNYTNKNYDFFPLYNIGWIDPTSYPSRSDVKIVLQQKKSGNEIEIAVTQPSVATAAGSGCWYQFGRKDPMPTTDVTGFTINSTLTTASLSTAITNPNIFYKVSSGDWCSTRYDNLWTGKKSKPGTIDQDADMIKTIYDPSPVGYKMPASNAFTGFTKTGEKVTSGAPTNCNVSGSFDKGWYFYIVKSGTVSTPTVFFPAAGCRDYSTGKVNTVGSTGNYWSAVPYDAGNGYYLYFDSGRVWPVNYHDRAYGFSVRPVLE